jgi:ATP-binding cassette, subfamily B, heavy metal transporter
MFNQCYRRGNYEQPSEVELVEESQLSQTNSESYISKLFLQYQILKKFFPYLWPSGKWDIKFRIIISFLFLFASKGVDLATPFAYKAIVDHLTSKTEPLTIPWLVIILYGFGKLFGNALSNLVDSTFLPVTQNALKGEN